VQEDFPFISLHELQIIDATVRLERIQENVVENRNLVFRRRFLTAYDFILEVIHEARHIDFVRTIGGAHFARQTNPYGGARKEHFPPSELHHADHLVGLQVHKRAYGAAIGAAQALVARGSSNARLRSYSLCPKAILRGCIKSAFSLTHGKSFPVPWS
jgi:hypothetical protein